MEVVGWIAIVVVGLVVLGAILMGAMSIGDAKRYLKIRRM